MSFRSASLALTHRTRVRLKAGVLALLFAIGTFLPWIHMLAPGHAGAHACRHGESTACSRDSLPSLTAPSQGDADSCWVCDSVTSLLHPNRFLDAPVANVPVAVPALAACAPRVPHILRIGPSNRSQAPPARV